MRTRFFNVLAKLIVRHPWKIVSVAVLLTVVSAIYAATSIKLNANLDDLVSEKLDYHRRYIDFLKEFGDEEYLYVVVDASSDISRSKEFMEDLGKRLKENPKLKQVMWKIENPALEKNFLLYLSPEQLNVLKTMTTSGPFSVRNIATWDGFAPMFAALAGRIAGPVSPTDEAELATGFTFIDGLLDDMTAALQSELPYKSRLQALFFGDGETFDPDGFIKNGDLLLMFIMPEKDYATAAVIEAPLKEVRSALAQSKEKFPGLTAGLTGRPVLSADEMETSNRDMSIATTIAIILVSIVFIIFFRGVARPMCAVASLVMGISWTFGFLAIAIGKLNILSSVFALLLIGASIEYSIYIVARYEEELAKGGNYAGAIKITLANTAKAQLTSALTTAAAFLTLMWTDFSAIAELGLLSAVGIVLCLVSMLVVLPALLVLRDRNRPESQLKKVRDFDLPVLARIYKRPRLTFACAVLLIFIVFPFAAKIGFDNNLLNLQARGLESVRFEHLIIDKSSETTWFARAVADTVEESKKKAESFAQLKSVRKVDDVERIVPADQKDKMKIVGQMAPAFEGLSFVPSSDNVDARGLMFDLGRLASNLERLEAQAFSSGRADAVEELAAFSGKMRKLVQLVGRAGDKELAQLGRLQKDFFDDLHKNLAILSSGMNPTNIALSDLPPDIRGRFVSPSGRYSLYIYPKENIWDPQALAKFVEDIRSVDPKVVGTPIEVHESSRLMRETFLRSAILAFFVICLLVWLDFKNARASLITILPLATGLMLLLGFMGMFGIQFNMANFFAIPIIIGTGVDFGVQVVHRLRQEKSLRAMGTSTGRAILMTAAANGVGFGTMMIAHHRGVASLGAILVMGCICCLITSLVVAPPVAKWLNWGHKRKV